MAPRIVSLLPSATEIAVALGLEAQIVGRSHECDFPASIADRPVLTASKLAKGLDSAQIELGVQAIVSQGLSVYEVDAAQLRELRPDVILTQSQCAVCAVTPDDLREALSNWIGAAPLLISLAPDTLGDVWGDFDRVADATGVIDRAAPVVASLQLRLDALANAKPQAQRPRVAAIEWIEPLMAAGNWVPELIEIAGGEALFAMPGQHSPWITWDALVAADPDVIVMMPCGYRLDQSLAEVHFMTARPEWQVLTAVRHNRVFIADGQHFFNRPGPRLVDSAAIIADVLWHADDRADGPGWVRAPVAPLRAAA